MKESDLRKLLTTPTMDQFMDQNIIDNLRAHENSADKNNYKNNWLRTRYRVSYQILNKGISKIAIAIILLALAGVGTAWAAGFLVNSYPTQIKIISEDEFDKDISQPIDRKNATKKKFGAGNKQISLLRDMEGNVLAIDEEGYYTLEDGSKLLAPYVPDPNRYQKAIKSGEEAFAEIGYPNLIPTYLYENYILGEDGFVYTETNLESGIPYKEIMVEFVTDAYEGGDFHDEVIWVSFYPTETPEQMNENIHLRDDSDGNYNISSYTNQGGIVCSILEETDRDSIIAHIGFNSETIGNGNMMLEFISMDMDKIKEILDTFPFTEETFDVEAAE